MLPPLYARWMEACLPGPIAEEAQATCHNCAMVDEGDAGTAFSGGQFHPGVKCCSYLPLLPNFTVGAILRDKDLVTARGRETTLARLRAGDGVTPLGIQPSRRYGLLYDHSLGFGQSLHLLCPHFVSETGGCGIWRHRNGVCSTWFCKFNRGAVGERFWKALEALLSVVETDLSWWAALEMDPGAEAVRTLLELRDRVQSQAKLDLSELEGSVDPQLYQRVWGSWYGREEEFFQACAERVAALTWDEVLRIVQPMGCGLARMVEEAHASLMSDAVPDPLVMGSFTILEANGERTLVRTYRPSDPLSLSSALFRILPHFNGRPNQTVVGEVVKKERVFVGPDLLRRLADYEVLVPAPKEIGEGVDPQFSPGSK